jgi:hypothetical protein
MVEALCWHPTHVHRWELKGAPSAADSASANQFWHSLADLAAGRGFVVEDLSVSGLSHVHVEEPC